MFEVGFTEIVLILGIALLVLGPQRLPKLAADLGRWAGKARGMARQLKTQLEQEASTLRPVARHVRNLVDDPRTAAGACRDRRPAPRRPAHRPAGSER